MIKHLNFKTTENSGVYFFSDIHGKHSKSFIIEPRGFKNADEALEALIINWNSKVSNESIGFLLGDTVVGAGQDSEKVFSEILLRLNYKELYLMGGNHVAAFKQRFERELSTGNAIDDYYRLTFSPDGWKQVHLIPNYYEIVVDKQFVVISHYPILSFPNMSKGAIMLFGHCHNNLTKSPIGIEYLKGRVLDVCPESIGNQPISFSEVMVALNEKRPVEIDHH